MPAIPIHNETEYDLTPLMLDHIRRDAIAHFGDSIHAIRVQCGIDRPAFNVKTGEVRYAFFPSDYEFSAPPNPSVEADVRRPRVLSIDDRGPDLAPSDVVDAPHDDTAAPAILDDAVDVLDDDEGPELKRFETAVDALEVANADFL